MLKLKFGKMYFDFGTHRTNYSQRSTFPQKLHFISIKPSSSIIFLRLAPAATGVVWESDANFWNKTADLIIPADKNCYTITGWGANDGTWSYYGNSTAVEDIEVSKPQARKVLINQSLYLVMPNGDVYDISGRQVR